MDFGFFPTNKLATSAECGQDRMFPLLFESLDFEGTRLSPASQTLVFPGATNPNDTSHYWFWFHSARTGGISSNFLRALQPMREAAGCAIGRKHFPKLRDPLIGNSIFQEKDCVW